MIAWGVSRQRALDPARSWVRCGCAPRRLRQVQEVGERVLGTIQSALRQYACRHATVDVAVREQVQEDFFDAHATAVAIGEHKADLAIELFLCRACRVLGKPAVRVRHRRLQRREARRFDGVVCMKTMGLAGDVADKDAVDHMCVIEDAREESRIPVRQRIPLALAVLQQFTVGPAL